MLVLSRKLGQRVLIGDRIAVTVVHIGRGAIRLGIEAPRDCAIVRSDVEPDSDSEEDPPKSRTKPRRTSRTVGKP